jgi:peptidoglycan/LPS O-acetylase OafA/YrhL
MTNPERVEQQVATKKSKPVFRNWPLGLAIVAIGGVLLARNLGVELFFLNLHNWWALFILVAAVGPLQQAYVAYRQEGMGASVANSLISAAFIVFIALIFLIDLSFFTWWPVFVILGGLSMMTNR